MIIAKWPNFGSWPQLSAAECWAFINISSLLPVFYIWYNVHACLMWYLSFWWDSAESISNSNMSSFSSLLAMVKCKMCYSHNIFKVGSNLFCLSFSLLQPSPGVLAVVSMLTATTKLQSVCVISASPAAAPTHVQECTYRAASLLCTSCFRSKASEKLDQKYMP